MKGVYDPDTTFNLGHVIPGPAGRRRPRGRMNHPAAPYSGKYQLFRGSHCRSATDAPSSTKAGHASPLWCGLTRVPIAADYCSM
nr:hypothetical protein GCM10020093_037940 [Planobispora longispora]